MDRHPLTDHHTAGRQFIQQPSRLTPRWWLLTYFLVKDKVSYRNVEDTTLHSSTLLYFALLETFCFIVVSSLCSALVYSSLFYHSTFFPTISYSMASFEPMYFLKLTWGDLTWLYYTLVLFTLLNCLLSLKPTLLYSAIWVFYSTLFRINL